MSEFVSQPTTFVYKLRASSDDRKIFAADPDLSEAMTEDGASSFNLKYVQNYLFAAIKQHFLNMARVSPKEK